MLYSLEQGPVEQKIIGQCLKERLPFPDSIRDAPELLPGLELFFLGFLDLTTSRSVGMGVGPIPWKVIFDYCQAYGMSIEQTEDMVFLIREMDTVFMNFMREKDGHTSSVLQKHS